MGSSASASSQATSRAEILSSQSNDSENSSFVLALHREFQQTIDDVTHLGYPPPSSPTTRKLDFFRIEEFECIDLEACKMPLSILSKRYEDVASYLTQNAQSDTDRIRSIFRWITSLDLSLIQNTIETLPDPGTPLDYLLKINWQMGNHAHFLAQVTRAVGMPCVLLNGINKSSAYQPGRPIDRSALKAQWNAVYVDGQWRLIDVFWASTCVVGSVSPDWKLMGVDGVSADISDSTEPDPGKTVHQVNEFFFLTDPDQLIFTHFPDDAQWQLLPNAITFEQFESSVYIRERFFQLEMEIVAEELKHNVLFAENGGVLVSFKLPEERSRNFEFRYILFKSREDMVNGENLESSIPLDLYVFYEKCKDLVIFDARFPAVGKYKLDLFGRDRLLHETFDLICSYFIECAELKEKVQPFPDCPEIGWGPGTEMEELGMKAVSHKAARVETLDGQLEFRFAVDEGIEVVYHSLLNNSFDEHSLSRHAVLQVENCELIVTIRLPQPGEYALELFAGLKKDNGEEIVHNVCNYFIHCLDVKFSAEPFPKLHEGEIGADPVTETSGARPLTHRQGLVSDITSKFEFTFEADDDDAELFCTVQKYGTRDRILLENITRSQNGRTTQFLVDGCDAGEYALNVYGRHKENPSAVFHVHSYLAMSENSYNVEKTERLCAKTKDSVNLLADGENFELRLPASEQAIVAELHKTKSKSAVLHRVQSHFQLRVERHDNEDILSVKLKEIGQYQLDVFKLGEKGGLEHCSTYFIVRPVNAVEESNTTVLTVQETANRTVTEKKSTDTKTLKALQHALKKAIQMEDVARIQDLISTMQKENCPRTILDKANQALQYITTLKDLMEAMRQRKLPNLNRAISTAEKSQLGRRLKIALQMAHRIREELRRLDRLRHAILDMDSRTIAEVKSYHKPPLAVFCVLAATYQLLGEEEKDIKDWKSIQFLLSKTGSDQLKKRVADFDIEPLTLNLVGKIKKYLQSLCLEAVQAASAGAATFFVWVHTYKHAEVSRQHQQFLSHASQFVLTEELVESVNQTPAGRLTPPSYCPKLLDLPPLED